MAQGITIDANINLVKFAGQVDKMSERMDKFQAKTESVASQVNSSLAAMGVGISIAGMLAFAKSGIDAADALNDMADRTGIAVEKLAGFTLATKNADTNMESFAQAANKLSVNIGKNAAEFAKLGISAKDPADAFLQLADVFSSIQDPQDRAAFGAKALGKSYAEMAPLLLQGGDALREQVAQGQRMASVTTEQAKAAADFNDKLDTLTHGLSLLSVNAIGPLLPQLGSIANGFAYAASQAQGFSDVLSGDFWRRVKGGDEAGVLVGKLVDINKAISTQQEKLQANKNNGRIGSLIDDLYGFDPGLEQRKIDNLIKQRQAIIGEAAKFSAPVAKVATTVNMTAIKAFNTGDDGEAKKLKATTTAHQAASKALTDYNKQQERYMSMREGANADVAFKNGIDEYSRAFNTGAISIQDYIFWLTKLDDTRNAARPVKAEDTGWADIMAIQDETAIERANSAQSYLDKYNASLADTKNNVADLGSLTSAIFDGSLGGVNLMAGAFENLTKSILKTNEELENNRKAQEINNAQPDSDQKFKNAQLYAAKEKELQNDNLKSALTGVRQVASATASMFKENTNARRAFNVVALAASVSERMADLAGLSIKAASAVLEQGKGDPYTAFARMAAMAAIVGSVLAAAGAGTFQFGGSSTPKGAVPNSPDSGTVLGDTAAKSESISKTYQLLQDIHAREYRELRGINSGVAAMQKGITDSVTRLFQSGGLTYAAPGKLPMTTAQMFDPKTLIGGISPMLGKLADPVTSFLLKGIFGTVKQKLTGGGIYAGGTSLAEILNGGDISAQQFTEITKTKKSWFSKSSKVSEVLGPVNADFQDSLSVIFRGMGTSMMSMSTEFGKDMTNSINNYVIPKLKISLYGLSSDDMIKTLNNVLSTQLDTMTSAIFGELIKKYQKLGEGLFETATRLVSEKAIVLDAIDLVGSSFKGDAIAMADGLVQLAGGIKEFQAQFDDYYRKFYSESEQLANTTRRLTSALADMGLIIPGTRDAYRDLVNVQQLDTEAGRERYDQLLKLSTAADTYYSAMEKLRESMKLLSQDTFKTAVDYKRYLSLASLSGITAATNLLTTADNTFMPTGNPAQLLPGIASSPVATAMTTVAESNNAVAEEIRQLRIEQQAQAVAIAQNTSDTAKILQRWNGDGMPAVRVIA